MPKYTFNFWSDVSSARTLGDGSRQQLRFEPHGQCDGAAGPITGLIKEVPGYWVFNAMAKHPLNEHVDLQFNVNNIANRYYYDELHPGTSCSARGARR